MTTQKPLPPVQPIIAPMDDDRDTFSTPEVMDEADAASLFQMTENQKGIAAIVAQNAPEKHPDFDGESCVECGVTIPKERLALHKVRCFDCQTALEKRNKLFAGRAGN